mmetsp:Transcript_107681/g.304421  ORF Transcript_107681/g.304421 Transcript_107681/m.304421 type:complete len:240 (+) Transcript_107681:423-1142(+)
MVILSGVLWLVSSTWISATTQASSASSWNLSPTFLSSFHFGVSVISSDWMSCCLKTRTVVVLGTVSLKDMSGLFSECAVTTIWSLGTFWGPPAACSSSGTSPPKSRCSSTPPLRWKSRFWLTSPPKTRIIWKTPFWLPSKPYFGRTLLCTVKNSLRRSVLKALVPFTCLVSRSFSLSWNSGSSNPSQRSTCSCKTCSRAIPAPPGSAVAPSAAGAAPAAAAAAEASSWAAAGGESSLSS